MKAAALVIVIALAPAVAAAKPACPSGITAAATQAVPDATVLACSPEHEDGIDKFEVKLARKATKSLVEVDVAVDGNVMAIEERITLDQLPGVVTKAFAAKYPKAKLLRAERETVTGKGMFFEVAFDAAGKQREATFKEDGSFVEEE